MGSSTVSLSFCVTVGSEIERTWRDIPFVFNLFIEEMRYLSCRVFCSVDFADHIPVVSFNVSLYVMRLGS